MKQHITIDDLNQLSEKGKEKLRVWWKPNQGDVISVMGMPIPLDLPATDGKYHKEYGWKTSVNSGTEVALPLLSIGQMIEFLREKGWLSIEIGLGEEGINYVHCLSGSHSEVGKWFSGEHVSDALWEAVKDVLEHD